MLYKDRLWLDAFDNDAEIERTQKLHTLGTCEWILKHKLFKGWLNEDSEARVPGLVIYGIPGRSLRYRDTLLSLLIYLST